MYSFWYIVEKINCSIRKSGIKCIPKARSFCGLFLVQILPNTPFLCSLIYESDTTLPWDLLFSSIYLAELISIETWLSLARLYTGTHTHTRSDIHLINKKRKTYHVRFCVMLRMHIVPPMTRGPLDESESKLMEKMIDFRWLESRQVSEIMLEPTCLTLSGARSGNRWGRVDERGGINQAITHEKQALLTKCT